MLDVGLDTLSQPGQERTELKAENVMQRYWFEFDVDAQDWQSPWSRLRAGCGVSGRDEADCLSLIRDLVLDGRELPALRRVVPEIDVSTLDARHVVPNMGSIFVRGIWFPVGYR